MKTVYSLCLLVALLTFSAVSTTVAAQELTPNLHLGVGIGNQFSLAGAKGGVPPVFASYDHPITEAITVGGYLGYTSFSTPFLAESFKYSYLIIGARGTYHLDLGPENLDPYGGLLLGYNVVNAKYSGGDLPFGASFGSTSGVAYSFFVGANYNFNEKFGAFAELGYGIAWLQLGLNVRL